MIDPRKLNSLLKSGKYSANANLIGLTQNVFMRDSEAQELVASGNFTTADVILSYNEKLQELKRYNHNNGYFELIGGGSTSETAPTVNFVAEDEALPLQDGKYIFRSGRPADPIVLAAAKAENYDSDTVKGSLFELNQGTWTFIKKYDDLSATINDSDGVAFSKIGRQRWSTLLQTNQTFDHVIATRADFTDTLRNESPGFVYVDAEQELYYWSATNDQTQNFGWQPFYPIIADAPGDVNNLSLNKGLYLDNRSNDITTGTLGYFSQAEEAAQPGTFTARAPVTATVTLVGSATNTHVTRTPDSDNEVRLATNNTWQEGMAHWRFNNNFRWHAGFEVSWYQFISSGGGSADALAVGIGGDDTWQQAVTARGAFSNSSFNGYSIFMDIYDSNNYVRHARLYGPGGQLLVERANISGLRSNSWIQCKLIYKPITKKLEFWWNGTKYIDYDFAANDKEFSKTLSPKFSAAAYTGGLGNDFYFGRYGIRVKYLEEGIPSGNYLKLATTDYASGFELVEGGPVTVSTGTRYIKSYDSKLDMIANQTIDHHFDGGIYKVQTIDNVFFYEYNVSIGQTPTGTMADYNEISRKHSNYSTEGAMFADQANQVAGQWYFIDNKGYLYNGGKTMTINDYAVLEKSFDPVAAMRRENMVFQPQNLRKDFIWHDVRDAADNDFIRDWQDGTTNLTYIDDWTGNRNIVRSSGGRDQASALWDIKFKIPAGTASVSFLCLNDRSFAFYASYDDGKQEFLGKFGGNNQNRTHYPNVTGYGAGAGNNNTQLSFVTVPTSISHKDRWIRIQSGQDLWFGGIYYTTKNEWCYTNQFGYAFDTGTDLIGGTAPARNRISSVSTINNPQSQPAPAWNGGQTWNGEMMFSMASGTTYELYPIATSKTDSVLYFQTRGDDNTDQTEWAAFAEVTVNDSDIIGSGIGGANRLGAAFSPNWQNPIAPHFNYGVYNGYMGIYVPADYIRMRYDSDGNEVPTPQKIRLTRTGEGGTTYYRSVGFHKIGFAESSIVINPDSDLSPVTYIAAIHSFASTDALLQDQLLNGPHVEGGLYKVINGQNTYYFEYTVPQGQTPTGTMADYQIVTRRTATYTSIGAMLADQAGQPAGQWNFVGNQGFLYDGSATGTINDYKVLTNGSWTDVDKANRQKQHIFLPDDVTSYYDDIEDAEFDGVVSVVGTRDFITNWNGRNILKGATGWDIIIPAGTSVLHLAFLNDRRVHFHATYLDGNLEYIGAFGGGFNYIQMPGPFGVSSGFGNAQRFGWISVPVSKSNIDRTIRIQQGRNTSEQNSYITAVAFSSENRWAYTYKSGISMHRGEEPAQAPGQCPTATINVDYEADNWEGATLVRGQSNTTYRIYVTATEQVDQLFYFYHRNAEGTDRIEMDLQFIRINGDDVVADPVVGVTGGINADPLETMPMSSQWINPAATMNRNARNGAFVAVKVPATSLNFNFDANGNLIPTPQLVEFRLPTTSSNPAAYFRGCGFMRYDINEFFVILSSGGGGGGGIGADSEWVLKTITGYENVEVTLAQNTAEDIHWMPRTQVQHAKLLIGAKQGTEVQAVEVVVTHNNVNAFWTEYANVTSGNQLFTISFRVTSTQLILSVTPNSAATTTFKVRTMEL